MSNAQAHRLAPWIIILAGVVAAVHVGKLPPAVPVLQSELGISLVQAGFLLSLVQLGSVLFGLVAGLVADSAGLRRCMLAGLALLTLAGLLGAAGRSAGQLLLLRALESVGFLLTVVPAPGLLRQTVLASSLTRVLGIWGGFFPLGAAFALLVGPLAISGLRWQGWWVLTAALSALVAWWMWRVVPVDGARPIASGVTIDTGGWPQRLRLTLTSRGPWLAALLFMVYSGQWLAVVGFLPTLYQEAGWGVSHIAVLTALVAAANISGNVAAGYGLHNGVRPAVLLWLGFAAMAAGAWLAFAVDLEHVAWLRYAGALMFSAVGGLIPGTLWALAPSVAPNERSIASTVGWMQQLSALGQFSGPPLVAWVASRAGGWHWTWVVTGACCCVGAALVLMLQLQLRGADRDRC